MPGICQEMSSSHNEEWNHPEVFRCFLTGLAADFCQNPVCVQTNDLALGTCMQSAQWNLSKCWTDQKPLIGACLLACFASRLLKAEEEWAGWCPSEERLFESLLPVTISQHNTQGIIDRISTSSPLPSRHQANPYLLSFSMVAASFTFQSSPGTRLGGKQVRRTQISSQYWDTIRGIPRLASSNGHRR